MREMPIAFSSIQCHYLNQLIVSQCLYQYQKLLQSQGYCCQQSTLIIIGIAMIHRLKLAARYPRQISNLFKYSNNKQTLHETYQVLDIKNSHIITVKDSKSSLPFLSQIVTQQGVKGIVLKLQQQSKTIIGLYQSINFNADKLTLSRVSNKLVSESFVPKFNHVYNINMQPMAYLKDIEPNNSYKSQFSKQNKRVRINTLSPILSLCHDIFVGDLINFSGPLGSYRTHNALQVLQSFTNSNIPNTFGVYLNTNHNQFKNSCLKAASKFQTISFAKDNNDATNNNNKLKQQQSLVNQQMKNENNLSSVGVYMLAVKCIQTAIRLKNSGKNVILVIDNIQQILANQWTILQSLKLPISPFSIFNQLYSNSSDNIITKSKQNTGSLTTIIVSNSQDEDVIQQDTTYSNNNKYLRSLCPQIEFPLQIKVNNNRIVTQKVVRSMRAKVNWLVKQKKDKQLLFKLKLNKDQPWENYFILDSDWWVQAIKNYRPTSFGDRNLFLWFIDRNIQEDYCAHWKIGCIQAYNKYLDFLARPEIYQIGMDDQQLDNFLEICKAERIFDIFKRDYLN